MTRPPDPKVEPFMDRLVDWRDFEHFVRDLYDKDGDVRVEHDITLTGKSGARRQIDVLISQTIGLHTYNTIVECKRWKKSVDRQRIDELATSIEDLNASKGVLFTTTGFEEGAELYAKHKGIDLFIVRDLKEEEWGHLGRLIWVYLHTYSTIISIKPGATKGLRFGPGEPGSSLALHFDFRPDSKADPMTLDSTRGGGPGPNLRDLVAEARLRALQLLARDVELLDDSNANADRYFRMNVQIDLKGSEHTALPQPWGVVLFERFDLVLDVHLSQHRVEIDRGKDLDIALAVENYLTNQRHIVTRNAERGLAVLPFAEAEDNDEPEDEDRGPLLENGQLFKLITEPWVEATRPPEGATVNPTRPITFSLPDWDTTISPGPSRQAGSSVG